METAIVVLFMLTVVALGWCLFLTICLGELQDKLSEKLSKGENPWQETIEVLVIDVGKLSVSVNDALAEMRAAHKHLGIRIEPGYDEAFMKTKPRVMLVKKCSKCGGEHEEAAK